MSNDNTFDVPPPPYYRRWCKKYKWNVNNIVLPVIFNLSNGDISVFVSTEEQSPLAVHWVERFA